MTVVFVLIGCVDTSHFEVESATFSKNDKELNVKHAQGFDIKYSSSFIELKTQSFGSNSPFESTARLNLEAHGGQDGMNKIRRICCQSSTHLAFIDALGELNRVVGQCGLQYVTDPVIRHNLDSNGTREICQGEKEINEVLLDLNPDIYFTYPYGRAADEEKNKPFRELIIAEYLEVDPIARLEWLKLFGILFQKAELADSIFESKKSEYLALKQEMVITDKPTFMMNLPYGDSWNQPSAKSLIVSLIEDAGFNYLYHDSSSTENHTLTLEKAWSDGAQADYWIVIANRAADFSMQQLLKEEEVYQSFKSVQENQVIFCNSSTTGYFTKGVLEPEIMLQDLIDIRQGQDTSANIYFNLLK